MPVKNAVNPNDLDDGDSGANSLQNYPVITAAYNSFAVTSVTGADPYQVRWIARA